MIVWLNGTFGVGKTTTARELTRLLAPSRIFDPEQVGYLLRHAYPELSGDFQHLAPWRPLVCETAVRILDDVGGTLIVPQTILVEAYAREIFAGLAAAGILVRHFVLHAEEAELRRRIEEDEAETSTAREWRRNHVAAYRTALPWLRGAGTVIDTTGKRPFAVAEEIRTYLRPA